ncbi:MAG: patatin-like phospholipase family protein [Bacteroidales bacterium]|nr:patatin-like phospholipase family protein [Bacteroidales bacterium]MBD5288564.1 patatin-like phospholipase family protein [Bacteroides sp.]
MKNIFKIFTTAAVLLWSTVAVAAEKKQTVGLVLSGGGAKGIAHVGVIRALEENDIPVNYVTGTSMGAIVGSLYSCGWSPEKMMKLFKSEDFKYWSTGVVNPDNITRISRLDPTPQWVGVNVSLKDSTGVMSMLPTSLISPIPMNIEFLELYSPYTLQCKENFNNLFVPFRCVTSDVYHKHKVVLSKGSLGDAVRASMSFPLVFRPIKMNGVLVYDGGIYDNFPVNVMQQDFDPDFIIGVSVSGPDQKPQQGDIYSQLEDMIIQNNDYNVPSENGIKIQVPVLQFGVLDFDQAQTIYDIGYKTGLAMVDSIKKRVYAREPLSDVTARRERFAAATPEVVFDSVSVSGAATPGQAHYLEYLFEGPRHRPFTLENAKESYYRAVTDGTLSNLVPKADFGTDGHNKLLLDATVKKPWSIGVGGWITSSTNSMLYLDLGFHTLSFNSLDVDLQGWIGQSYYAGMLSGRFSLRSNTPSYLEFMGVAQRQKYYDSELLFYQTSTPTFITESQNFLRMKYVWAMNRKTIGFADLTWGYESDSYYPTNTGDYASMSKDKTQYFVTALRAGFKGGLLNDPLYPSSGMEWRADVQGSYEKSRFTPNGDKSLRTEYKGHFRGSMELYWKQFFPVAKHFSVGGAANLLGTLQQLPQDYIATLVHAPAFAPTPSTQNYFNEAFRSDNYVAAGIMPIWSPVSKLQVRGDFYVYSPIRDMRRGPDNSAVYKGWFNRAEFIGEMAVVYNFPFASLSLYGNYLSYPARNWNFGINFGLLFHAPRILR